MFGSMPTPWPVSYTHLAISGFAVRTPLLVAVGAVVGTSGLVLTRLMCKAMNRSLSQVLAGKTVLVSKESDTGAISVHEAEISEEKCKTDTEGQDDFLSFIRDAKSVIVIPEMCIRDRLLR